MTKHKQFVVLFCILLTFLGCAEHEQTLDEQIRLLNLQSLPEVQYKTSNPYSEEKVRLGKLLFYDPVLSGERDLSCATCHHPNFGFADGIDLSIGPGGTGIAADRIPGVGRPFAMRNSQSIINTAYNGLANRDQKLNDFVPPMTWANVRRTLEAQSLAPIGNLTVMRGNAFDNAVTLDSITKRLQKIAEYVELFDTIYGGGKASITGENLGKTLAAFQQSLISTNSPYDKYVAGQSDALNVRQKNGLLLFFGKANCSTCHGGPMFSDYALYNLGIPDNSKLTTSDLGNRQQRLFRAPSLRNVALTAPYMHNGTFTTLRDVLNFYNSGLANNDEAIGIKESIKIVPLNLTAREVDDLISFLEALTDESYDTEIPRRVPSGLKPIGN